MANSLKTLPLLLLIGTMLFYSNLWPFKQNNGILNAKDLNDYTYAYFDFLRQEVLEHGELPLWNPYQFAGISVIGNGEVNLFYPPNWLIYGLESRQAVALSLIFHGWLGMYGVALLAHRLGASPLGGLAAGLLWGGCGFIGARLNAGHYTLLLPLAWLPWVLAGYHWAAQHKRFYGSVGAAIALGMVFLSGHPQIGLMTGVCLLVFTIFEAYRNIQTALSRLFLIVLWGSMIGALGLLPIINTALGSDRQANQDRLLFANEFSLPAQQLISFAVPGLLGGIDGLAGDANFEELFAYSGWLPLLMAVLLLRQAKPRPEVWLLVSLGALGVILSLAMDGGLLRLMVQVFPPFGLFRSAARWLVLTQLSLACLAGLGITWLQQASVADLMAEIRPITARLIPILIMLAFMAAIGLSLGRTLHKDLLSVPPEQFWQSADALAGIGIMLGLLGLSLHALTRIEARTLALVMLIGVGVLDVWAVTLPFLSTGGKNTYREFWADLSDALPAKEITPARILIEKRRFDTRATATGQAYLDIYGYEQLRPEAYLQWIVDSDPFSPFNRLLGVEILARADPFTLPQELALLDVLVEDHAKRLYLYAFRDPVPRAFIADAVHVEKSDRIARDIFAETNNLKQVIVPHEIACQNASSGQATITTYRPNQVEIAVQADSAGLLFLSDRYDSGWKAEVNGRASPIYRADTTFRAVCVPSGQSTVVFRYRPASLYSGAIFSGIGLLGAIVSLSWLRKPS